MGDSRTQSAAPPRRTWRPMALWSAAIVLALGLAWFAAAIAVPAYQTRKVIMECDARIAGDNTEFASTWPADHSAEAITRLGGPERAAERLDLYLRLPRFLADRRGRAALLLGRCGRPAVPGLIRALSDPHGNVRLFAARSLGELGPDATAAIPALERLLEEDDQALRRAATDALAEIRWPASAGLSVDCPATAKQFELCELTVAFPDSGEFPAFKHLPDTQVHDAYDADRDGVSVRLTASFSRDGAKATEAMVVPGFAMRETPDGPWLWRVRWSPPLAGTWRACLRLEGRPKPGLEFVRIEQPLERPIEVAAAGEVEGPLVAPRDGENPAYLRRLRTDGSSEALWLFGACRAWVVDLQDVHNDWAPDEWLDRETELLAPMRAGGFNLLNQWMAPWEFLLVHRDRAEFWPTADGRFRRVPLAADRQWSAFQCLDQGRALAFDRLVRQCEGGPGKPAVRLLLSPLPHQCLQTREHPWGSQESGWSVENDAGRQSPERLNGFSAFRRDMSVWDFFEADPRAPRDDWRSQLFDHQANFWRYLVARWGHSRALGVWVLVDELDAVGDAVGVMSEKKGWWGHPQCDRWLADTVRLFRGGLERSGGGSYDGDPWRHPLHAATTSFGGQAGRGGNIDWPGAPADSPEARPDLMGFHWYPSWPRGSDWTGVWDYTVAGVASYSRAGIGARARLVSEFGAADRRTPADEPSRLYPTLYHHAIWAAVFSGQAGTPMDWDDGKQFGELCPRDRPGIFDREHYPIDHVGQMRALRRFLAGLRPDSLRPCAAEDGAVRCVPRGGLRAFALHSAEGRADGGDGSLCGWLFAPGDETHLELRGLPAGTWQLQWFDPWTGEAMEQPGPQTLEADGASALVLDAGPALERLRSTAKPFPEQSRLSRGRDAAFKLSRIAEPH